MNTIEKVWWYFFMIVLATFVGVGVHITLSPKKVVRYELGGDYSNGIPTIKVNVENASDYTIHLSKEVTWDKAVSMVDSLNKTLK